MNRKQKQQEPEPQEETPEEPEQPETPSPTPSDSPSTPDPAPSPRVDETPTDRAQDKEMERVLAAVQRSAQLQVQNLELVTSRVGQMADSLADVLKLMNEGMATLKTSAELMQEFMAQLNEQTERLVDVSAALIRYSQEQQAMIASGGTQA